MKKDEVCKGCKVPEEQCPKRKKEDKKCQLQDLLIRVMLGEEIEGCWK